MLCSLVSCLSECQPLCETEMDGNPLQPMFIMEILKLLISKQQQEDAGCSNGPSDYKYRK